LSTTTKILVVGVNWLGDACMTMPALQRFRQQYPGARLAMLVKPSLTSLWHLHPAIDDVLTLEPGNTGLWRTASRLRREKYGTAYIFPNSWRSAIVPFLAGIPNRIGAGRGARRVLLTRPIRLSEQARAGHQQWEYADILGLPPAETLPEPALVLSRGDTMLPPAPPGTQTIGLIPGAARGASKQWPESHFLRTVLLIQKTLPRCRFAIFGTAAEAAVCQRLADALPASAITLAGRTTLPQLAAALGACDTVICNDSGGMHLAAAAGTPVVAVYGLTDPAKTGPLGTAHQCIRTDHPRASRDIARRDTEAIRMLETIAPERVALAAMKNLHAAIPPSP
jgi:heptosyltransferase-2